MKFKVIKPKSFKPDVFKADFEKAMEYQVQSFSNNYKQSYKTWKHKPYFQSKVYSTQDEIIGKTWTSGKASKQNPYPFIERGTKVRRALLSFDWQSQTKPGRLASRMGRGKVVFISKKVNHPGIKARNFTGIILKTYKKRYPERMSQVLISSAKKSGHYIKV